MSVLRPDSDLGGFTGKSLDGFVFDFAGTRTRRYFNALAAQPDGGLEILTLPVDEEVFEWLDIIESIETSRRSQFGTYTFAEFGAGYGRWSVRAHHLARRATPIRPFLILVEAEPQHLDWLALHMEDNEVSPDCFVIHRVALASEVGQTLFYVGMPQGTSHNSPAEWYGQSIVKDYERVSKQAWSLKRRLAGTLRRTVVGNRNRSNSSVLLESGWQAVPVATKRLRDLIPEGAIIDLADFDVQGVEFEAISESIDICDSSVRMLHIGTHSEEIEAQLRQVLVEHRWECVRDYSLGGSRDTEFGVIAFVDGVQTWINPRLRPAQYSLSGAVK